jgi:hypothetical protein
VPLRQGLKPDSFQAVFGTAEAVPFHKASQIGFFRKQ